MHFQKLAVELYTVLRLSAQKLPIRGGVFTKKTFGAIPNSIRTFNKQDFTSYPNYFPLNFYHQTKNLSPETLNLSPYNIYLYPINARTSY
jgi:hypothetical protein